MKRIDLQEVLAGLGAFLIALAVVGACLYGNNLNNEKVREMTRLCVEHGHAGWDDSKGCF